MMDIEEIKNPVSLEENAFLGYNRSAMSREFLPVSKHKLEILYSIENFSCTIIIAETGSGKTTQIPQFLYEAGYSLPDKLIGITLPRRVAAISVAQRVSHELNSSHVGFEVGYHVRFDERCSEKTRIKYMTDGILVNEMMQDPLISKYSVIMIDDIHERTINSDIVLALLKKIRNKRNDLKLIVSSATLDAEKIANYFTNTDKKLLSNVLYIEGRVHPVDIYYLSSSCKNYVVECVKICWYIHLNKKEGDILVFLTGQEEIEIFLSILNTKYEIEKKKSNSIFKILGLPLYAGLPMENQMAVFDKSPNNTRKIIAATNIAESSITIDGIVYVVDSCLFKLKYYDFRRDFESLVVTPVSKSAANQRAGRAGRVKPGECYRLCTAKSYNSLIENSYPEILISKLENPILQIKSLGITNLLNFDFLDKPNESSLIRALETLFSLQIIDKEGNLTEEIGSKLSEVPLDIKLAVMLLNSFKEEFSCSEEILILVSVLAAGNIWYLNNSPVAIIKAKKRIGAKEGDMITLINVFLKYNKISNKVEKKKFCSENSINENVLISAKKIMEQIKKYLHKYKLELTSSVDDVESILRCIASAFFANVAQRQPNGCYKSISNEELLTLHPSSILTVLYPTWILYYEIVKTEKFFLRECIEIDYRWLIELAPHYYQDNKAQILENKHFKEVAEHFKNDEKQEKEKIEINLEKEMPRYNKILKNMNENLDKGKIFKKESKTEMQNKKQMLTFDYDDA